jgi:Macrocin-O-methyltransferase (TylF)
MPGLSGRSWAIVRLDGDTYDATQVTLRDLYPGLVTGGYLIVDDYGALEECSRAVDEFREQHGISEPLEEVDWTGRRWRRETDAAIAHTEPQVAPNGNRAARPVERPPRAPVPTFEELRLAQENAELRQRLAATESALADFQGSPLHALKTWMRSRSR